MKATLQVELQPFQTPNFVHAVVKAGLKQDGMQEVDMSTQPTCPQLLWALNNACMQAAFGEEARTAALCELRKLRNARTTWCGQKELDLRREIDRHLEWYAPNVELTCDPLAGRPS
jgi:hypothetical protein